MDHESAISTIEDEGGAVFMRDRFDPDDPELKRFREVDAGNLPCVIMADGCKFTDAFAEAIIRLAEQGYLTHLDVSDSDVSRVLLNRMLSACKDLRFVILSNTSADDSSCEVLCHLDELCFVNLAGTKASDSATHKLRIYRPNVRLKLG